MSSTPQRSAPSRRAEGLPPRSERVVYLDDAALARAAIDGDLEAMARLWDRDAHIVRRLLRRTFGPSTELEDMTQEVFVAFFERIGNVREPSKLRSYLVSVTLNRARSELRRRAVRRWVGLSSNGELPPIAVAQGDHSGRRALRALYAILDELSANARIAFVLRHIDGMELTEVGETMGWSLATTKRKLKRAYDLVLVKARAWPELSAYLKGEES